MTLGKTHGSATSAIVPSLCTCAVPCTCSRCLTTSQPAGINQCRASLEALCLAWALESSSAPTNGRKGPRSGLPSKTRLGRLPCWRGLEFHSHCWPLNCWWEREGPFRGKCLAPARKRRWKERQRSIGKDYSGGARQTPLSPVRRGVEGGQARPIASKP